MEEKWKKLVKKMMAIYGPIFATGSIFATGNFIFLKMLINCEQSQKSKNFHKKVDEKMAKKESFFAKNFY